MTVYTATVTIKAPVKDTEVEERVRQSILNIFPDAELETVEANPEIPGRESGKRLEATSHSVEGLKETIERRKINDTARAALFDAVMGDVISFQLRKQSAYGGVLNFDVGGHELGAINVRIESENPKELIDYIAPATEDDE